MAPSNDDTAVVAVVIASNTPMPQGIREGLPPPEFATMTDYLPFHVTISLGRIDDEQTTVVSANAFARWFFAGFAPVTGNLVDEEHRPPIYNLRTH